MMYIAKKISMKFFNNRLEWKKINELLEKTKKRLD